MSVDDLVTEIRRYERFIKVAGGGVTLSGGEPLQQPALTRDVLTRCKELGLHTALDTSGFLGDHADNALLDATDLVLLDIKSSDQATYRRVTRTRGRHSHRAFRPAPRRAAPRCGSASSS
jgi:pyruvate formate lyase activating enzyme